jgi:hypothetical protein
MTSKLYEMLVREYPPEGGNQISIYGADERIYLSLFDRAFVGKGRLISPEEIEGISWELFLGFYKMREVDGNHAVILNPDVDFAYREYDGHLIMFMNHFSFPQMEIWTGNRGNSSLKERQREKYFEFVKKIYERFRKNAGI